MQISAARWWCKHMQNKTEKPIEITYSRTSLHVARCISLHFLAIRVLLVSSKLASYIMLHREFLGFSGKYCIDADSIVVVLAELIFSIEIFIFYYTLDIQNLIGLEYAVNSQNQATFRLNWQKIIG